MRTCPFNGCGASIPDNLFACKTHWFTLSEDERAEIWNAYRLYISEKIGVEELRQRQQKVLGRRGNATEAGHAV